MTNVAALKELYVALGGDADDVAGIDQIADMIHEIASVAATATAAELPDASEATDGQVLTVVDGAWAAADLPS